MSIRIKYATPADAELIADMSRQTFYETFAASNSKENMDHFMNEIFTREELIKEVGAEGNIFFLACEEDQPLGYVRMREGKAPEGLTEIPTIEIARIYANTNAIGKGVGSALMKECLTVATKLSKRSVWLGVWENNERAIQFYTRWGFEKFGEHVFMLGDDPQTDWLLKKVIS